MLKRAHPEIMRNTDSRQLICRKQLMHPCPGMAPGLM
jgi:hypothetical protein